MSNLTANPYSRLALFAPLFVAFGLAAQEPNVLPLAKTYHVGMYTSEIEIPSGTLRLFGGIGSMTLTPGGIFSGSLDAYETDLLAGTIAKPNDPFSGEYSVRGSGICMLDLDPLNPGTDLGPTWITSDGSVLHAVTSIADNNAASLIAIEVGSGLSNATLAGNYRLVGQRVKFDASTSSGWRVDHEFGTATFDGFGSGAVSGTKVSYTGFGGTANPLSGPFTYTVANDGALTIGSSTGGCSADGELLFLITAEPTGEVGVLMGVRVGSSYDLQNLVGRHSFTGHRYELGASSASLPRTTTIFGELSTAASSATNGTWNLEATAVATFPVGQAVGPWVGSGAVLLGGVGLAVNELTMSEPGRTWSLWSSQSGRFFVGREPGPHAHQLFGSRQCPASIPAGSGTAGAGGAVPRLGMRTYPQLGNTSFAFAIEGGVGGALCAIPIATAGGPGLPAFGGTILIDPTTIGTTAVVVLGGTPGAVGAGSGLAPLPIPNTLSLIGFELWAQALVFDAAATGDVALSNAYQAVVCR